MKLIYLFRFKLMKICTIGIMIAKDERFFTLELPWLGNKRNVSCIPRGEYECRFMERSSSGKYKNVYHVLNVDNRSGILIHNGNLPSHTRGCILVGGKEGVLGGIVAVLRSRSAMSRLVRTMDKQNFKLKVM